MRSYKSYRTYVSYITMQDKIFSCLSCLTYGLTGFLWIIISHLRGQSLSSFARFHVFQSIFVFIAIYVVGLILNILLGIVQIMPFIGAFIINIVYFLKGYPLIFGLSAIPLLIQGLSIYMAVSAFLGKYAEIPGVSETVRKM